MINSDHLYIIQGVINRMAQTSFILKGWNITLVVAMIGFSAGNDIPWISLLSLVPSMLFAGLDAFYLRRERLYRCLYAAVIKNDGNIPPYSMKTDYLERTTHSWVRTLFSRTIFPFYFILSVVAGGIFALQITNIV